MPIRGQLGLSMLQSLQTESFPRACTSLAYIHFGAFSSEKMENNSVFTSTYIGQLGIARYKCQCYSLCELQGL
jgi:hypothetical protein